MKEFGWFAVIAGAVVLEIATAPGTALSGDAWKLSRSGSPGMVHFTIERSRHWSHSVNGSDVPLANFHGFSLDMLDHSGPAKFEYVQDAGRLQCQGKFAWGRGSGNFTLTPNPSYVAELDRLGFASPQEDDLFLLMLANVDLQFARTIHEADIGSSLRQLIDLRLHGVTTQYIRDVNAAGYRDFHAQDYIDLRTHGVATGFLWDLKSAGYNLRAQDIIDLRMHGVNSRFADDLKQAGYNLSASQITDLSMHGVNSAFVRDLKIYGLRPSPSDLVQLRMHGVTSEYLRGIHEAYGTLSADDIVDLQQHGVPSDFAVQARDLGYHFTPHELIDLRMHGVDAGYLRTLHDSGMRNLSEPQITQLRMHGVE